MRKLNKYRTFFHSRTKVKEFKLKQKIKKIVIFYSELLTILYANVNLQKIS